MLDPRSLEDRRDELLEGCRKRGIQATVDAAINVYCLIDLEAIFEARGNRGYRCAQLEGGIRGGLMYLEAYAQRFGATGLIFLDDEEVDLFSPHAEGKSEMFLTALGRSAR